MIAQLHARFAKVILAFGMSVIVMPALGQTSPSPASPAEQVLHDAADLVQKAVNAN